ncbi:PAS domain-containing sensor histidine kinase [Anoxynatronum buryatiense]|uniref:Circadian input-output histidine kinase CikA n=1 Tax=Anoxynatronum buryatiense TaxID=489973 RepID=A0AA45WX53_9CLOT|nr:ATP-binding protein [Anoxynatronum buryatiense]SMP62805.1 PAS domain S-box-containing protein [Anoxynatronum buryatiense]
MWNLRKHDPTRHASVKLKFLITLTLLLSLLFLWGIQLQISAHPEDVDFFDLSLSAYHQQKNIIIFMAVAAAVLFFLLSVILIRQNQKIKKSLRQARDSHHLMTYTVNHSPSSIVVLDKNMDHLYASNQFKQDYDVSSQEIIGKCHYDVFPDIPEKWRAVHQQALQGDIVGAEDDLFQRADGSLKYSQWECRPWYYEDNSIGGIIIYTQLIHERKMAELKLQEEKEKAEAASRSKSLFLANMSHELRTPLNGMMGMSQLMQLTPLNHEQQEYMRIFQHSCSALVNVVNEILNYSSLDQGFESHELKSFRFNQLLDEVKNLHMITASAKKLVIHTTMGSDVPHQVVGDSYKLKQVLHNLVGNAVKFTEKGVITLSCEMTDEHVAHDTVFLEFRIRDTGIGISADHLTTIYEAFQQVDNSNTRKHGGLGLGLTITKKLVHMMNGTIDVESEEHTGSCFILTLPFQLCHDHPDST